MSSSNVEESPQSDSKMDISDTTNSMESTGVSPVVELPRNNLINTNDTTNSHRHKVVASAYMCSVIHNDVSQNVECAQAPTEMQVERILYEKEQLQGRSNSHHTGGVKPIVGAKVQTLDNRYVDNICLPRMVTLSEKHLSSLTVANNHPLMSPTGTDSDSENSCLVQVKVNRKFRNYPDVIPNSERGSVQKSAKPIELFDNELNTTTVKSFNQKVEGSSLITVKNNMNGNKTLGTKRNKLSVLRSNSPDLLSSGSEADVSQYHAAVESNFQSVVLLPNVKNENDLNVQARLSAKRTGGGGEVVVAGSEDVSSLDSISNHSFDDDEDIEHNLASLSPSSSLIDGLEQDDDDDDDDDDDCEGPENADDDDDLDCQEGTTPTNMKPTDALPQYSVEEERRDSRNWQKLTLPDGTTRDIDMKVIEPYKRVLSHGGYLKAGGHNAIVIFCACHLPDRSRADYNYVMDNLFLYVVKTLDQLVTEDYVLIYLHGGTSRRNVPPFPWLKKCYQLLDRRLRKSLKNMYLVHPTFWIKSIVWMARPFVSTKFWRKLIYVKSLTELGTHVAVEKAAIPDKVKQYDAKYN